MINWNPSPNGRIAKIFPAKTRFLKLPKCKKLKSRWYVICPDVTHKTSKKQDFFTDLFIRSVMYDSELVIFSKNANCFSLSVNVAQISREDCKSPNIKRMHSIQRLKECNYRILHIWRAVQWKNSEFSVFGQNGKKKE